jgi:putative ABC transport system substrate-binding protein
LVALEPDVLLASGSSSVRALERATKTVPIVFANASDPVGAGLVASLAKPESNATGFLTIEFGMTTKWLEFLKQLAPALNRVAVVRDPTAASGQGQFGAVIGAAASMGLTASPIDPRDSQGIERDVAAFARNGNGGLIVSTSRWARIHRDLIVGLAARFKLPAVYPNRFYVTAGGLISYGPDYIVQFRQAAGYVDRVLKGEKPGDMPVQAPTKYELVINLKTAKDLGLDVPAPLLARADEVIE